MWVSLLLVLLEFLMKLFIEKWIKGGQKVPFGETHADWMQGRKGRSRAVATVLFDRVETELRQVPAGATFDINAIVSKASKGTKAQLG